jgi:hypothetical protein
MRHLRIKTRLSGAVRDSLLASLAGYLVSVLLTEVTFYWPRLLIPFRMSTVLWPWMANICNAAASLLGWLVFLLPIALIHRRGRLSDNAMLMCFIGGALGFAITWIETRPLVNYHPAKFTMREFYIAAGIVNAITSTLCLIALRRRASLN